MGSVVNFDDSMGRKFKFPNFGCYMSWREIFRYIVHKSLKFYCLSLIDQKLSSSKGSFSQIKNLGREF